MIEVSDIHVTFAQGTPVENHALRGLSIFIPEGEFVTVIGSNGAGKSTLLNAVSGEIGLCKPHPETFATTLTQLDLPPTKVI